MTLFFRIFLLLHRPAQISLHQPFVFEVNVKVEGSLPKDEKKDLAQKLSNQLDDSLRTQVVSIAGLYRRVISPPVLTPPMSGGLSALWSPC